MSNLNVAAKPCDYCNSAAALLFCRVDSSFMCISCDAKVHNADDNKAAHERVWMCEVCEQAPASVTCKADAASLCVTCDRDIHSANPLARRHEREAVVPFYDTAESIVMKSTATAALFAAPQNDATVGRKLDSLISDSWISTDSVITTKPPAEMKLTEFLFSDSDQFLDFDNYQICYADSLVPVRTTVKPPFSAQLTKQHSPENKFEIDFTRSNITSSLSHSVSSSSLDVGVVPDGGAMSNYTQVTHHHSPKSQFEIDFTSSNFTFYNTSSLSHSVSSSSLDVGVVPDGGAISETSYPFLKTVSSSIDLSTNQASQVGMDREARVLRYREKRKNRKFEKTIRYASRKAYAETRPRVKGRFAKRTDSELDIDGIFSFVSGDLTADTGYGVVPSF